MALAPFFNKTALAAAAILQNFDRAKFISILETHPVALCFDGSSTKDEGRVTLDLSANLLARLYPTVVLMPLDETASTKSVELERLMRAINPLIEIGHQGGASASECTATAGIVVGRSTVTPPMRCFYAGSRGWLALVGTSKPVASGNTNNPIGAAAAACFAVANLFRLTFAEALPRLETDEDLCFCTLHHAKHTSNECAQSLPELEFGEMQLVGGGAIGNAVLWVLSRIEVTTGQFDVIDPQVIDVSNLQRYVLTAMDDVDQPKTTVAVARWSASLRPSSTDRERMVVVPHQMTWSEYLAMRSTPWRLRRVALAVDSARDRLAVQAALPLRLYNAWTQAGDLGVSRHVGFGASACVACLYMPDAKQKNEDEMVAEAIGLPKELMKVRVLLHNGAAAGEEFVRAIAAGLEIEADELLPYASQPLRKFYSEAVCGGLVMRLQGSAGAREAHVPMAFQSALAGVLLAGTLVADAAGLAMPQETKTTIDLLRPLGTEFLVPVARNSSGRCICADRDFLDHLGA